MSRYLPLSSEFIYFYQQQKLEEKAQKGTFKLIKSALSIGPVYSLMHVINKISEFLKLLDWGKQGAEGHIQDWPINI